MSASIRNMMAFGKSSWWDKMWASYVQLNPGIYSDDIATEFKNRCKPTYVENYVYNGGGVHATNFVDSTASGTADNWGSAPAGANYASILSIVTGNGFTRAQRSTKGTGANLSIANVSGFCTVNKNYTITFKYRCSKDITLLCGGYGVKDVNGNPVIFSANTGSAIQATATFFAYNGPYNYMWWAIFSASASDYIEIGEVTISPSVSQNYYTVFGPTGQNKTVADWVYLLTCSGNLTYKMQTKSGNALKWNSDGVVNSESNALLAYTKDTNAGIVTVSSTDGWGGVTLLNLYSNNFVGIWPNFKTNNTTIYYAYLNSVTRSGSAYISNAVSSASFVGCSWTTAMVDAELKAYYDMFAITPPIKNLTLNLSGSSMGIPTGGANNTYLLGIMAKFTVFTASIIIRTS